MVPSVPRHKATAMNTPRRALGEAFMKGCEFSFTKFFVELPCVLAGRADTDGIAQEGAVLAPCVAAL